METRDKLYHYITSLNQEELKVVCFNTIRELLETEIIKFSEESNSPYWDFNGESLEKEN